MSGAEAHCLCFLSSIKADLQNRPVLAYQPSRLWRRECHAPISRDVVQRIPGVSLVRSPGRAARVSSDDNRVVLVPMMPVAIAIAIAIVLAGISQSENRSRDWRSAG